MNPTWVEPKLNSDENTMRDQASKLTFESSLCNICGSADGETYLTGPDRLFKKPGTFQLVRCHGCGVIRQYPRPTWKSLQFYYPDEDYVAYKAWVNEPGSRLSRALRRHGVRKWLRSIERQQQGGRMLDIGCGTGAFLREAKDSGGWQLEGLEPNQFAAEFVRKNLDIPVHNVTFPDVTLPLNCYDVITMWNVLEHLQMPSDSIRYVAQLLKPGGWFVFSIPNVDSIDARLAKKYWVGWDLPRHLYLLSVKNVTQILEENGFTLRDKRCLSTTYSAIGHSLTFWANDAEQGHVKIARAMVRIYENPLAHLALVLPYWLIGQLRLSSVITIYAERIK